MTTWVELVQWPTVTRIGWTLVHFLWQGAALALVWAILRTLLRRQEARVRYLAACSVFGAMVVAPLVTFAMLGSVPEVTSGPSNPPTVAMPTGSGWVGELSDTVPAVAVLPRSGEQLVEILETSMPWLVLLWAVGVGALSLRLLHGFWSVNRLTQPPPTSLDAVWLNRIEELRRRLAIRRPVRLLVSAAVLVPTVVGWLRPVILFPIGALGGLAPHQIELILAHELAHIRRHDHWVNLLQVVVETVLFYHPAVWWVSREMRAVRELCCDDLAVETCGDRLAYARALTALEAMRGQRLALGLGAGGGSLLGRIRHLLGLGEDSAGVTPRGRMGSRLIGLGLLLFAAGVVCLALSPKQYVATCKVLVQSGAETPGAAAGVTYDPYLVQTEYEVIRSSSTLEAVAAKLDLGSRWKTASGPLSADAALVELRQRLDIRQVPNSAVIEIRATGRTADEAAELANAVAEMHMHSKADLAESTARNGIRQLQQELDKADDILRKTQMEADDLKLQLKISDRDVEGSEAPPILEPETVRRLEAERIVVQAQLDGLSTTLKLLKEIQAEGGDELHKAILNAYPDADLSKLTYDLILVQSQLAKERVSYSEEHPSIKQLSASVAHLTKKVDERVEGILRGIELQLKSKNATLDTMREAVENARDKEAKRTVECRPYFVKKRELEDNQKIRDAILLRVLHETVDATLPKAKGTGFQVIEKALPPAKPVRRLQGHGLGLCLLGLIVGMGGIAVRGPDGGHGLPAPANAQGQALRELS